MHGPHPGAYEGSIGVRTTSELAVMLDCYQPLSAAPAALAIEDDGVPGELRLRPASNAWPRFTSACRVRRRFQRPP